MFKINNVVWQVFLVSPHHPQLYKINGSFALGVCVNDRHTIYINKELSLNKLRQVLCHEITHAAMFSYDIWLTDEQEEFLADLLATYGSEIINITNKIFNKIKKG